jgi:hypothetical protein
VDSGLGIPELSDASIILPELLRANVNPETAKQLVEALRDPRARSRVEELLSVKSGLGNILEQWLHMGVNNRGAAPTGPKFGLVSPDKSNDMESHLKVPTVAIGGDITTDTIWKWKVDFFRTMCDSAVGYTGCKQPLAWGPSNAAKLANYFFGFIDQPALNQVRNLVQEINTNHGVPGKTANVAMSATKRLGSAGETRAATLTMQIVGMGGCLAGRRNVSPSGEYFTTYTAQQHGIYIRQTVEALTSPYDDIQLTLRRLGLNPRTDQYLLVQAIIQDIFGEAGWTEKEIKQHVSLALFYDELFDYSRGGSMGFAVLQPQGHHDR